MKTFQTTEVNPMLLEQTRMALHSNIEVINTLSNLLHQEMNFSTNETRNRLGLNQSEEQIIKTTLLKYVNNL